MGQGHGQGEMRGEPAQPRLRDGAIPAAYRGSALGRASSVQLPLLRSPTLSQGEQPFGCGSTARLTPVIPVTTAVWVLEGPL